MSQGRHGIKVLGLSLLAALGLMAFAASAQAGEYKVEGKTFTTHGLASEKVEGTGVEGELLVPGLGITFNCKKNKFSGTVLLGGVAHASVLFEECSVLNNTFCKTFETKAKMESGTEPGFLAASGLGELVLMGGSHYLLVASTEFSTIYLSPTTKGCTLPLENKVSGSTVLSLPTALSSVTPQTVEPLSQASLEALFPEDKLLYGAQVAWLDGAKASVSLTGALAGKPWGAE